MTFNKLSIIGGGKVGEALISSFIKNNLVDKSAIYVTNRRQERSDYLVKKYGIHSASNRDAANNSDVIFICVKPQVAEVVLNEIKPILNRNTLVISIMAGTTISTLENLLNENQAVVRVMPNTPLRVGKAMSAICGGNYATPKHIETTQYFFDAVGRTLVLDEKYFDAVTGLSASGPAFIYIVIESLAEGGVKAGLPRNIATELAAQACFGAASMVLETGEHPALLKDEVTTPAGCTIDGILKLEEGGIRVTLIKTVMEASIKAGQLGKK